MTFLLDVCGVPEGYPCCVVCPCMNKLYGFYPPLRSHTVELSPLCALFLFEKPSFEHVSVWISLFSSLLYINLKSGIAGRCSPTVSNTLRGCYFVSQHNNLQQWWFLSILASTYYWPFVSLSVSLMLIKERVSGWPQTQCAVKDNLNI